jgi:hypothetical protein
MIPVIPRTWYLFAALVLANMATAFMWQRAEDKLDAIAVQHLVEKAEARRVIEKQIQITEDTTNGWKAALDSVRQFNSRRVLPTPAKAGELPGAPAHADAADPNAIPAPARLAEDCAFTTLTANQLQDWVRRQEEVTK